MSGYDVVDEEGSVIRSFRSRDEAQKFADSHNEDRHPNTMEYFVRRESGDADKPVARLQIDTRAYGPLVCEHCEEHDPDYAEAETALLMEDGGVVCEECHTPRNALGAMEANRTLKGSIIGRFEAPDITAAALAERGCTSGSICPLLAAVP